MANTLILNQAFVLAGLPSYTFTIPTTKLYSVHCECTDITPSGLTVTINDNGTPIYTSPTVTPTQIGLNFKYGFMGTSGHTITVVCTGNSTTDVGFNNVEVTCTLQEGL